MSSEQRKDAVMIIGSEDYLPLARQAIQDHNINSLIVYASAQVLEDIKEALKNFTRPKRFERFQEPTNTVTLVDPRRISRKERMLVLLGDVENTFQRIPVVLARPVGDPAWTRWIPMPANKDWRGMVGTSASKIELKEESSNEFEYIFLDSGKKEMINSCLAISKKRGMLPGGVLSGASKDISSCSTRRFGSTAKTYTYVHPQSHLRIDVKFIEGTGFERLFAALRASARKPTTSRHWMTKNKKLTEKDLTTLAASFPNLQRCIVCTMAAGGVYLRDAMPDTVSNLGQTASKSSICTTNAGTMYAVKQFAADVKKLLNFLLANISRESTFRDARPAPTWAMLAEARKLKFVISFSEINAKPRNVLVHGIDGLPYASDVLPESQTWSVLHLCTKNDQPSLSTMQGSGLRLALNP